MTAGFIATRERNLVSRPYQTGGHRPPLQWRMSPTFNCTPACIVVDWGRGERIHFVRSEIPEGAVKERSMDSKKAGRRKFLKGGAAAAVVGAIQSASGQTP